MGIRLPPCYNERLFQVFSIQSHLPASQVPCEGEFADVLPFSSLCDGLLPLAKPTQESRTVTGISCSITLALGTPQIAPQTGRKHAAQTQQHTHRPFQVLRQHVAILLTFFRFSADDGSGCPASTRYMPS